MPRRGAAVAKHHRVRDFPAAPNFEILIQRPAAELLAYDHGRAQPRSHERITSQLPRRRDKFFIPVSQGGSAGSTSNAITAQSQNFGVQLNFTPYVLADESIRLNVNPIVSTIDTGLSTSLVAGGSPVPGLDIRQANTTVEMRQGQTLAIAGLLSVAINASTSRIPGLGDLPYIGPMFSNTSHQRVEKELLVLVTPYLVGRAHAGAGPGAVPVCRGEDVKDPTDLEFYLKNRIEGRNCRNDYRSDFCKLGYAAAVQASHPLGEE